MGWAPGTGRLYGWWTVGGMGYQREGLKPCVGSWRCAHPAPSGIPLSDMDIGSRFLGLPNKGLILPPWELCAAHTGTLDQASSPWV